MDNSGAPQVPAGRLPRLAPIAETAPKNVATDVGRQRGTR